jgi:hypothetical protein
MQSRARTMPSELQIGKEMHRVLVDLQMQPDSSIEVLAAALASASDQWAERLAPAAERSEATPEGTQS